MKQINLLLVSFALLTSTAALAEDPATFCSQPGECPTEMTSVVNSYKKGINLAPTADMTGYSGKCFHMNPSYEPTHPHHGGFVIEKRAEGLWAQGLFSFFTEEDPFKGMTPAEMRTSIEAGGSSPNALVNSNDHQQLIFQTAKSETVYWFRTNKAKNNLLVIGRQSTQSGGTQSLVFCNMKKH